MTDPLTRWRLTADLLRRLANAADELLEHIDIADRSYRAQLEADLAAVLDEVHQAST